MSDTYLPVCGFCQEQSVSIYRYCKCNEYYCVPCQNAYAKTNCQICKAIYLKGAKVIPLNPISKSNKVKKILIKKISAKEKKLAQIQKKKDKNKAKLLLKKKQQSILKYRKKQLIQHKANLELKQKQFRQRQIDMRITEQIISDEKYHQRFMFFLYWFLFLSFLSIFFLNFLR